jgi:hypothetical protein
MFCMTKKKIAVVAIILFIGGIFTASAQGLKNAGVMTDKFAEPAGFEKSTSDDVLSEAVGSVIKMFLSLLGIVFILYIIYGGWVYMTAQGAEQKVEEALKIIKTSIIGLIIILAAYAISYYVFKEIARGTLSNIN